MRWCPDGFRFGYDSRKLRITFVLDCCVREITDDAASCGGYNAQRNPASAFNYDTAQRTGISLTGGVTGVNIQKLSGDGWSGSLLI